MAAQQGNVYATHKGFGIRWREGGQRRYQSGFRTKTEARTWFREQVAPRLDRGAPSAEISFDDFAELFLYRHGASVSARSVQTLRERLVASRVVFGDWKLSEVEHAAADVAAWRTSLPEGSRYRLTLALRQCLGAAVRWQYIGRNPAVDAGPNPEPRAEELKPFTVAEIDMLRDELGPVFGPAVVFAAETGLRTNEWIALERRDVDRAGRAVTVQRRFADGKLTPYPKTVASRRRVPLSDRALEGLGQLSPRIDTPLVFPAAKGGHIGLDTWRTRAWYPALEAAGIDQRGPYCLRHTFATEALAAGISIFQLARLMGTSAKIVDKTYGHLAADSAEVILAHLNARPTDGRQMGVDDSLR